MQFQVFHLSLLPPSCKTQHPFPLFVCFFFIHFDSLRLRATFFSVFLGVSVVVFQVFHLGLLTSSIKRNTYSFCVLSLILAQFVFVISHLADAPFLYPFLITSLSSSFLSLPNVAFLDITCNNYVPLTSFFPAVFYLFPVPLSSPP